MLKDKLLTDGESVQITMPWVQLLHDLEVLFGTAKQDVEERLSFECLFDCETFDQHYKVLEFHLFQYLGQ